MSKLTFFTDGGSRGNPGPAASAIYNPDTGISRGIYVGRATNNEAEYKALLFALKTALTNKASEVAIYADSELMVKQVKGLYRVNAPTILPLYAEAMFLIAKFDAFEISHVRREFNKEADREVNVILDAEKAQIA
jgi:ribonuclease HI